MLKNYKSKFCILKKTGIDFLSDIVAVQKKLTIGKKMLRRKIFRADSGLLISGYTINELEEYMKLGGKSYLARNNDGRPLGYILVSPSKLFSQKLKKAKSEWKPLSERRKLDSAIWNNNFIYLDQVGVLFEYHKSGLAYDLLKTLEADNVGKMIVTLIMDKPIDNVRSKQFFARNGYKIFCTVLFSQYGTIKNFEGSLLYKWIV